MKPSFTLLNDLTESPQWILLPHKNRRVLFVAILVMAAALSVLPFIILPALS